MYTAVISFIVSYKILQYKFKRVRETIKSDY